MKKFLLLLFGLTLTLHLSGQGNPIDSLDQLHPALNIFERVAFSNRILSYVEGFINPNKRVLYAEQYRQVAEKWRDSLLMGYSYALLKNNYQVVGDQEQTDKFRRKQKEMQSSYGHHVFDIKDFRIFVSGNYKYYSLKIFRDSTGTSELNDVRRNENWFDLNYTNEDFQLDQAYWAKMILRGHPEKTDQYLFIPQNYNGSSWQYIDAWLVHANGDIDQQKTGYGLRKKEKSIPSPINFLRFEVRQNERAVLYIRLEGVEKGRAPTNIMLATPSEEEYPDWSGEYQFTGDFLENVDWPFRANRLTLHEIYEDPAGNMTLTEVYNDWDNLELKDMSTAQPKPGNVYWLKARFYGSAQFSGEQILHITNSPGNDRYSFDYVDAYIPDRKGGYQHQQTGKKVPLKKRPLYFWATFLKLNINPADTLDLFVRLEGVDPKSSMPFIRMYHIDASSIWETQVYEALKVGLFFGLLSIQFLYFLFLYFIEKKRIHLYFSMLVLGFLLIFGFDESTFVLIPIWGTQRIFWFVFGIFLMLTGLVKYTEAYFIYSRSSLFSKRIIPSYLLSFALAFLYLFLQSKFYESLIFGIAIAAFNLIGFGLCLMLVFKAKKQKNISKSFYLVAFLPLIIFMLLVFSVTLINEIFGLAVPYFELMNEYFNVGIMLAVALMLILLALANGYRTNRLRAEKDSFYEVTSKFVPNVFIHSLGKANITEVALGDSTQREVTVLFTDIRNYTSLSEQMSPEENFQFVKTYNSLMGPIIQANKGFINQYLGDGIMAIFPDSPQDALQAAIQMQHAIHDYNRANGQPIRVGMGLHTGPLIMGIIGDANRLDATTISDTVNTASRIENLTKHFKVNILLSEDCLRGESGQTKLGSGSQSGLDLAALRYLGLVQVKGKRQAIGIYECFAGDPSEIINLKQATQFVFEAGIKHYYDRSFVNAVEAFDSVKQQNPADATAGIFHRKAARFLRNGIDHDWTGIEKWP